jgi:DNA topoisomerase-1
MGEMQSEQHFTQPPGRYTEASLVRALEEMGIGRPSTYAPTIGVILQRGYVESERKTLHPTELGRVVNDMMTKYFDDIVDIQFTASLEEKLDSIEDGGVPWQGIVGDFYQPFAKELEVAERQIDKVLIKDEPSDVICEKCGANMVYKMGRYGKFLACPNFPECRNTMPILVAIDAPCPKCGAKIIERTSTKGRKFYGCERYPECDFISWDMPVADKCEICGSYMTRKADRKGSVYHICANETCRHKVLVVKDEDAEE